MKQELHALKQKLKDHDFIFVGGCHMEEYYKALPEWGSLDILKDCGSLDPGSNPGSGASFFY